MVVQYPHTIRVTEVVAASYDDASGNYTKGSELVVEFKGRHENFNSHSANGVSVIANAVDGKQLKYNGIVYTPSKTNVKEGSKIEVFENETLLLTDTVKKYSKGQLNSKIWI